MSTKDKTREKLLGSMRKTKAAPDSESTSPARQSPTQQTVKKSSKSMQHKSANPAKSAASNIIPDLDSYQCGRRIWPD